MKKKALGFMLAATMTVSVLAGCGGNQNEGNTNEKENVTNRIWNMKRFIGFLRKMERFIGTPDIW